MWKLILLGGLFFIFGYYFVVFLRNYLLTALKPSLMMVVFNGLILLYILNLFVFYLFLPDSETVWSLISSDALRIILFWTYVRIFSYFNTRRSNVIVRISFGVLMLVLGYHFTCLFCTPILEIPAMPYHESINLLYHAFIGVLLFINLFYYVSEARSSRLNILVGVGLILSGLLGQILTPLIGFIAFPVMFFTSKFFFNFLMNWKPNYLFFSHARIEQLLIIDGDSGIPIFHKGGDLLMSENLYSTLILQKMIVGHQIIPQAIYFQENVNMIIEEASISDHKILAVLISNLPPPLVKRSLQKLLFLFIKRFQHAFLENLNNRDYQGEVDSIARDIFSYLYPSIHS